MSSAFTPSVNVPLLKWRPANSAANPRQEMWTVATSQTIVYGDLLVLSSGKASQALAAAGADALTTSGGNTLVLGMALSPITTDSSGNDTTTAPGVTVTQIPVLILDNNVDYCLRCYNATASASQLQDLTRGTKYLLGRYTNAAATASWYVFTTGTSNGEFTYIEPFGTAQQGNAGSVEQSVTDTYAAVWGRCSMVTANAMA